MKAKKLTANQVKNLINEVKEIYRLCGFETGKRTNLQKALKECRFDYAELGKGIDTSLCYPENVFNKEYQNEKKAHFDKNGVGYEIWFEDFKCYLFQMYETKYLIASYFRYCNVYRLIEKTESDIFEMFYMFLSDCQIVKDYIFEEYQKEFEGTKESYNTCKRALQKFEKVFAPGIDLYDLTNYLQEKYNF